MPVRGHELSSIQSVNYNRIVPQPIHSRIHLVSEPPEPDMIRLLMRMETPNALSTPSFYLAAMGSVGCKTKNQR